MSMKRKIDVRRLNIESNFDADVESAAKNVFEIPYTACFAHLLFVASHYGIDLDFSVGAILIRPLSSRREFESIAAGRMDLGSSDTENQFE